jgi:hypothetical protein
MSEPPPDHRGAFLPARVWVRTGVVGARSSA